MLLLVVFAFLGDDLSGLLLALTALSLHELCHTLMAAALGCRVSAVELEPFGFIARLEGQLSRWDELLIAASGPLFSLVAGVAFLAAKGLFDGPLSFFERFGRINLWIAAVNLLPAMPLDGGRAAKAALVGVMREKTAIRLLSAFGIASGALFFAAGLWLAFRGLWNITLLLWGLFLPLAAWREWNKQKGYRLSAMVRRMGALKTGGTLPVRAVAVHGSMSLKDALKLFDEHRYTLLYVLDDNMKKLFELDEARLLQGMARFDPNEAVRVLKGRVD